MSFQSELRSFLLADATLTALVGSRIYPSVLPAGATLPAIVYFRVGGRTEHKPQQTTTVKTRNFTVQIQAIAQKYDDADEVEEAIFARMNSNSSVIKPRPLGETQDLYDEQTRQYITTSDYSIWYTPA